MGKIKKIKQKYRSILRSSRDKENRNRLRNENITIISANCIGGVIYHDLGSPLISFLCSLIFFSASSGVTTPHILLNVYILKGKEYNSPL